MIELRGKAATMQVLGVLVGGDQTTAEVQAKLPWLEPLKVRRALENCALTFCVSRTGGKWSLAFHGRKRLRDFGHDVVLIPKRAQAMPEIAPLNPSECRPWASACADGMR